MEAKTPSVLVVGGGLVGLSAAVFLAWRGVPTVLVERHPGSSLHPRAIGYTPRTLELFRAVGLGPRIPQTPPGLRLRRVKVESLAGKWFEETPWTPEAQQRPRMEYSPCTGAAIAQDRLEPILRDKAIELGADIRLSTELISFEQSAAGVVASLRNRDGSEYTLRADYLVAADGHLSPIREALGIGRGGRGHLRTVRSVLFRAPLEEYLRTGISQFAIDQPGFEAFLTTYGDGRWVLIFSDDEERDEDTLRTLVAKAIGRSDLELDIITTGRWNMSALIADRFASGRVFLAGDAAHTLPPARGGYGANTGIEDAHNLAWKLSAVLSGKSTPALLDTYDAERRPIAWLRHQQIFARDDYKAYAGGTAGNGPILDDQAIELGQLYRSTAVLGADDGLPPALRPDQWAGQPGTRAPHLWVDDERLSTLDLFQRDWVLLAEDERWSLAAAQAGEALGLKLKCLRLGVDLRLSNPEALRTALGLGTAGASLIRPDGYVAWRSIDLPVDPLHTLTEALGQVSSAASLMRPGITQRIDAPRLE
jgi:putative polyketide hydroxylase